MLGIIVACVKLASTSELKFGFGLYAFVALLIVTGMLASSLDKCSILAANRVFEKKEIDRR